MTLVDTSSWIHFLRKNGEPLVKARVRQLLESDSARTCPIVLVELWMGAGSEKDQSDVTKLEQKIPQLEINRHVWMRANRLSQLCRRHGTPVPASDVIIAACAFTHGAEIEAVDEHYTNLKQYHEETSEISGENLATR
jgi:predicted nucleic acid-binding protein